MSDHPIKGKDRKPQGRKATKFWRLHWKKREFVKHFLACDMNEVEAAKRAGFPDPNKDGPRLMRSVAVQEAIEEQGVKLDLWSVMSPQEIRLKLTELARNEGPNQFKALDSLARMNGMYIDKLTVEHSRPELEAKIQELLDQISAPKGEIIEAEYTSDDASNTRPLLIE